MLVIDKCFQKKTEQPFFLDNCDVVGHTFVQQV